MYSVFTYDPQWNQLSSTALHVQSLSVHMLLERTPLCQMELLCFIMCRRTSVLPVIFQIGVGNGTWIYFPSLLTQSSFDSQTIYLMTDTSPLFGILITNRFLLSIWYLTSRINTFFAPCLINTSRMNTSLLSITNHVSLSMIMSAKMNDHIEKFSHSSLMMKYMYKPSSWDSGG